MLKISLLGTGRIGKMHAELINLNPKTQLEYVYDINKEASEKIAKKYGAKVAKSSEEAISNPNTDVVFIASATPTHINYILSAAKAGKAIFCEKPVDLDIGSDNEHNISWTINLLHYFINNSDQLKRP